MKQFGVAFAVLLIFTSGCSNLPGDAAEKGRDTPVVVSTPAPAPASVPAPASGEVIVFDDPKLIKIPVYFGSDRNLINKSTIVFGNEKSTISYGVASISIPSDHKMGELESPVWYHFEISINPQKHIAVAAKRIMSKNKFISALNERINSDPDREAFVFIHGFNVTFEDSLRRSGQLAYDLGFKGAAIAFSWPSQGSLKSYAADENTAAKAVPDLQRFLKLIAEESDAKKIHLIAHSMGSRVLSSALRELVVQGANVKFNQIILTAPDIDADVFSEQILPNLKGISENITLYASSTDLALGASHRIHKSHRLGEAGDALSILDGMDTVDATYVDTGLLKHSYYGDSRTVLSDMFQLLKGQRPGNRNLDARLKNGQQYWLFRP